MNLLELFGIVVRPRLTPSITASGLGPVGDDEAQLPDEIQSKLDTISGVALLIDYQKANGTASQRLITCRQLSVRDNVEYVASFCHHRRSLRTFRLDRIHAVFDPQTGEDLGPVADYFARFHPDRIAKSGLSWGLSVDRRADLIALITVAIFVARCDEEYHPLERDALETVLARFWLHLELSGDPDFDALISYSNKLAPDGEAFWLSLDRLRTNPEMVPLLRYSMRTLVEADGIQHDREFYWLQQVESLLNEGSR